MYFVELKLQPFKDFMYRPSLFLYLDEIRCQFSSAVSALSVVTWTNQLPKIAKPRTRGSALVTSTLAFEIERKCILDMTLVLRRPPFHVFLLNEVYKEHFPRAALGASMGSLYIPTRCPRHHASYQAGERYLRYRYLSDTILVSFGIASINTVSIRYRYFRQI
jgi:hypothetical protein